MTSKSKEDKNVTLLASEPSSAVKKYANEHMEKVTDSSRRILRALSKPSPRK